MEVIKINEDNVQMILQPYESSQERDYGFLNALWKYVLFAKNISRILPNCIICNKQEEFVYEGFGGIKKVGNGIMYIPGYKDNIYLAPDILFHYFYSHNIIPTPMFKDIVIHASKPDTNEYKEIVREVYCSTNRCGNVWKSIRCSWCGEIFEGIIAFRIGRNINKVRIYHEKISDKIFRREKYVGICLKCLHYTEL